MTETVTTDQPTFDTEGMSDLDIARKYFDLFVEAVSDPQMSLAQEERARHLMNQSNIYARFAIYEHMRLRLDRAGVRR